MAKQNYLKLVSPRGVAAYCYLNKPDSGSQYSDDKFKLTLVLDADDSGLDPMRRLVEKAAKEKWGKVPKDLKTPFNDGDDRSQEEFVGKILMTPKSKFKPGFVDASRHELPDDVWPASGDAVKFSAVLFPYESTEKVREGKKLKTVKTCGVAFQLRNVQLLEKNSGGGNAAADFDDEEGYAAPPTDNATVAETGSDDADDF